MKLCALAVYLVLGVSVLSGRAAAAKPNVLLIVVDDLDTSLGAFGQGAVKTPNIDRLVASGVMFDRAYTQFPLCHPSRTSFLSGMRPETTGVIQQEIILRDIQPDVMFLPGFFKHHGWFVAGAGKIFHKDDPISWDEFDEARSKSAQELAALKNRGERRDDAEAGVEWQRLDCGDDETGDGIVASTVVMQMERAARTGKPFFLGAGFRKPHLPWTAPNKYFDLYPHTKIVVPTEPSMIGVPRIALFTDVMGAPPPPSRAEAMAAYYACVSFIDAQVGVLLSALDRLELWDNTIVVFFTDHGYHLGDHDGLWAKLTNFERCARVPLAIVTPGMRSAGATSSRIVELLDVYPTLVELVGLRAPSSLEGKSLVPLLEDPAAPWSRAAYTVTIHEGVLGRSVRTDGWRYTEWNDGEVASELYDQQQDPANYHNLAGDLRLAEQIASLKLELGKIPKHTGPIPPSAEKTRKNE